MTPIDQAEFLERMMTLLTSATPEQISSEHVAQDTFKVSNLGPPMPELNARVRAFSEVFGSGDQLLAHMRIQALAREDVALANLLTALERGLKEGSFEIAPDPTPAARLSRYVYPVV